MTNSPKPPEGAQAALTADHLSKTVDGTSFLTEVSFTAPHGSSTAILGPAGSGRTTLLRIAAGLMNPSSGDLRLGVPSKKVSAVGLFNVLDQSQTGIKNLVRIGRRSGLTTDQTFRQAEKLLGALGLQQIAAHEVFTYPPGLRRRLEIAAALMRRPSLLLAEEPTQGIDSYSQQLIWSTLQELSYLGTTVMFTTEDPHEAAHLGDHVILLSGGEVAVAGSSQWLQDRLFDGTLTLQLTRAADGGPAQAVIARTLGTSVAREEGSPDLTVRVVDKLRISRALIALEQAGLPFSGFHFTPFDVKALLAPQV